MAITILPRDYNPWVQALPTFIQNMALQKMSQKFQGGQAEKERMERDQARVADMQAKGYVESEAHKPDVEMPGGKGLMAPQFYSKDIEVPGVGTRTVIYQKKYGQKEGQPVEFKSTTKTPTDKAPKFVTTDKGIMKWDPVSKMLIPTGYDSGKESPEVARKRNDEIVRERQIDLAQTRQKLAKDLLEWKTKWKRKNPDTLGINEKRILDKDLTTMAITIESDPTGPGARQAAKFFNDYATGSSVYFTKKSKTMWGGSKSEVTRVDLPVDTKTGVQITASDIRQTLKEEPTMTLEKILQMIGAIE